MGDDAAPLVKMQVDEDMCIGAGQCEMLEEETFCVDEETVIAGVIGTGMLPMARAEAVMDACPTQAISIVSPDADQAKGG